ncbi:hypothetical protein [Isoptericola sp. NPDC057191]|uniref:hypothetical protein n=1 Tax=Isoptericola sp. NPDC057191 TaxID=3346041 RepID=UPI0036364E80
MSRDGAGGRRQGGHPLLRLGRVPVRRAVVLGAVGAVLVLGAGGCSSDGPPEPDGSGLLQTGYVGSGTISLRPPNDLRPGERWSGTFGSILPCEAQDVGPLRITGLTFGDRSGPRPVSAVAYVRTFDSSTDTPIGSMLGDARDPQVDMGSLRLHEGVEGHEVDVGCSDLLGYDGRPTDEILVSLTADARGAHVGGLTLTYVTQDGDEHAVQADWDLYLCGSQVPEERCGMADSPPDADPGAAG